MKLSIFNAAVILAIGMMVIMVGVFLKIQPRDEGKLENYVILGGLALEFLGTVWFVLSLYRRRKDNKSL